MIVVLVVAAVIQNAPQQAAPPAKDVVVTGRREDERALEETIATGFSVPNYQPDRTVREFEMAERAAACAGRGRVADLALLRAVVDGNFNSTTHDRLQDRLVHQTATCGAGNAGLKRQASAANGQGLTITRVVPFSEASTNEPGVLARGAFMIEALRRFAPALALDRAQLHQADVVRRYAAREEPRARFRTSTDLLYFKVATCLVQAQPGAAIHIVYDRSPADRHRPTIARMIDRERHCVGGARKVAFDPIQFRGYLADALYRWAVAAQGVETLIPERPAE